MAMDQERQNLLEAILGHVVFDGWSQQAVRSAAEELKLSPAQLDALLPGGPEEALRLFCSRADMQMLNALAEVDLAVLKVRERVATAVRLRLEAVAPHREAVRRGLSHYALPQNGAAGLASLYRTVDAIWHGIGDRSVDYNFYSKRLLLAGVYSTTLAYWLNDKSEDFAATWAFLDRRISEVLKVGGTLGKTMGRLLSVPDRLMAARHKVRSTLRNKGPFARTL